MCKNTHTRNTCLLLLFFFFASHCYPAERAVLGCQLGPVCTSRGRGRHSQTQAEHSGLHHSPFQPASQHWFQPGGDSREKKGAIERKSDRKAHLLQWECNSTEQNQRNTHRNSILFVLCEHLIIIFIQIHCRSEAPGLIKWYECSRKTRAQQ